MSASSWIEHSGLPAVALVAAVLLGCGREDVELFGWHRSAGGQGGDTVGVAGAGGTAVEIEDCSASVPGDLLGARPPLGWNGYNLFGCSSEVDEAKIKQMAIALVDSGMQSAGYQYVNLDQCWQVGRDDMGQRVFDPKRLPSGLAGLASYLHARGLSLGVFAPTGDCDSESGGLGHELADARTYAAAGVDYVKYVSCSGSADEAAVGRLQQALRDTGRPIVLSLAQPPFQVWMPRVAQLWRTGTEATPTWPSLVESIDTVSSLAAYARPGAFNDPDMLEIGNGALSEGEQRVQLSVWSALAAPLLAGNDLTRMSETTRAILTNGDVIALDQDPLGLQAAVVRQESDVEVLAKPLAECGARGVVLWNRGTTASTLRLTWSDVWLTPEPASVWDLWSHTEVSADPDGVAVRVEPHDAVALRIRGTEPALPRGDVFLSDLGWTYAVSGYGPIELDTSNGENALGDGSPMRLRGGAYDKGLGAHAPSLIRYRLGQRCSRFVSDIGIDDETEGLGNVSFEVWADGTKLFDSGIMTGTTPARRVDLDVTGRRELRLFVNVGGDDFHYDHVDWAGARLVCNSNP